MNSMLPTDFELFPPIPADTANAAQLVIRNSNFYLSVGRLVDGLFSGLNLERQADDLQVSRLALARLYLITLFQYCEALGDKQAARALQNRVDWKFALHLSLDCHTTQRIEFCQAQRIEFCQFRRWLVGDQARLDSLHYLRRRLSEITLTGRRLPSSKSGADIVDQVCLSNRLSIIWGVMSDVLHVLASERPGCLKRIYQPHWYQRYEKFPRFLDLMTISLDQLELAQAIGMDGDYFLKAISECPQMELSQHPKVEHLRRVWNEQYSQTEGKILWRKESCASCPKLTEFQVSNNYISKGDLTCTVNA